MTDRGADWLDPEEFPFSEAELVAALEPWSSQAGLDDLPARIAQGLRECRLDRARAAAARARGSRDPTEINYATTMFPDEVWALMAELSPQHAERVEAFFGEQRRQRRAQRLAHAMYRAGLNPRATPTAAVVSEIDAEDARIDAAWQQLRVTVRRGVPPDATSR